MSTFPSMRHWIKQFKKMHKIHNKPYNAYLAFTTAVPLILTVGAHKGGSIELALVALSTCVTVDGGGRFSLGLMGAPMLVRLVLMRLALVRLVPLLDILMVVDISGMLFLVGLNRNIYFRGMSKNIVIKCIPVYWPVGDGRPSDCC